jgi:dTDP-4-amino-4,6-dideoxygalactose transaminase
MSIKFIDLNSQQLRLKDEINSGIQSVLKHGQYILGPEVRKFEKNLAKFGKSKYALGCANGTDAIVLPLLAWGIGPGDAVFCPSFTYCATAEAIANTGATPVFIDVHRRTYNIDPESLERAINEVKKNRQLVPRAVIAVDLFGQSANYPILSAIAKSYDLKLIADSAQGFGTTLKGKHPLHWADITTTSFFPAKPLGCYGDGGAILTNDDNLAIRIESLRFHGKGVEKYDNTHVGLNSRLDTLQAAILLPKLKIFSEEINVRNFIANRYIDGLKDHVSCLPKIMNGVISTWAQFTIEVTDPELFARRLKEKGIPTARYYPKPVHQQSAYSHFPIEGKKLLNTEDCSNHTISLPMHPYLDNRTQDIIIEIVQKAVK